MKYFDYIFNYVEGEMTKEEEKVFRQELKLKPSLKKEYNAYRKANEVFEVIAKEDKMLPIRATIWAKHSKSIYLLIFFTLLLGLVHWAYKPDLHNNTLLIMKEDQIEYYNIRKGEKWRTTGTRDRVANKTSQLDSMYTYISSYPNVDSNSFKLKPAFLNFFNYDFTGSLMSSMFINGIIEEWGKNYQLIQSYQTMKQQFDWRFNHLEKMDLDCTPVLDSSGNLYQYNFRGDQLHPMATNHNKLIDKVELHGNGDHIRYSTIDSVGNIEKVYMKKESSPYLIASATPNFATVKSEIIDVPIYNSIEYPYPADLVNPFDQFDHTDVEDNLMQEINFNSVERISRLVDGIGYTIDSPKGKYSLSGGRYNVFKVIREDEECNPFEKDSIILYANLFKGTESIKTINNLIVSWRDFNGLMCKFSNDERYLVYTEYDNRNKLNILYLNSLSEQHISLDNQICNIHFDKWDNSILHIMTNVGECYKLNLKTMKLSQYLIETELNKPVLNHEEYTEFVNRSRFFNDLDSLSIEERMDSINRTYFKNIFYSLFSNDAKYVLNAYGIPPFSNRFKLIDLQTKEVLFESYKFYYASFSKDSRYLILSNLEKDTLDLDGCMEEVAFEEINYHNNFYLYDLKLKQFVGKISTPYSQSAFTLFDFSPDGKHIIISNEKGLEQWTIKKSWWSGDVSFEKKQLDSWEHEFIPYPFYYVKE